MAGSHGAIGIYFIPEDGFHWADFLQQKLREYNIESMLLDLTSSNQTKDTNIILVSPEFFRLQNLIPLQLIDPHRSLMVLLGAEAEEVKHFLVAKKLSSILKSITLFETQATENCVKELIIGIIKLYEHVHGDNEDGEDDKDSIYDTLPSPRPSSPSRTANEVNDIYRVAVSYVNNEREVLLLCNRKGADEIKVELSNVNGHVSAIHENKAIYRFSLDTNIKANDLNFTARDGVVTIGTGVIHLQSSQTQNSEQSIQQQSRLETLQHLLGKEDDPICLMCQALNIQEKTKDSLDQNLAKKCRSLEPLRRFGGAFFENINAKNSGHSNELWPTLLHFAAEYDLRSFCEELTKLPWSMDACFQLNKNSETPVDIAMRKQYSALATILENLIGKQTRSGNVPGNKDSGVVEDLDVPTPYHHNSMVSTYADMTMGRDSLVVPEETDDDLPPPPPPHKTYVNTNDVFPSPCLREPPTPSPHTSNNSDSVYMDMAGNTLQTTEIPTVTVESLCRSKSESQAAYYADEEDEDEDYELPDDSFPGDPPSPLQYHTSSSEPIMTSTVIHEIQLPTHGERSSGFFKKFKLFGKHKKEKKRDRKMSLPTDVGLIAFQQQHHPNHVDERRGSLQQRILSTNRDSSSSTSSCESKEVKALALDTLEGNKTRNKKKHFLVKDHRKSIRITKAIGDQIEPIPLPVKKKSHLMPPEHRR